MHTTITTTAGEQTDEIELPAVFDTAFRPDLIRRAFQVAHANSIQEQGTDPYAGIRTSAESEGSGFGRAMVPRSNNQARRVPQAVGGRQAHPPTAEKDPSKALNDQERKLATRSAIAATADRDRVADRGHTFSDDVTLPIVLEDEFGELNRTQQVLEVLAAIGVAQDIDRADAGRTIRAGGGTRRGRKYNTPKSVLVVTDRDTGLSRGARNLAGADVATSEEVNVSDLAPGGQPGRLTIWTEAAIAEVGNR